MKKHFSILALASLIVTSTTFAVLVHHRHTNVVADGCPLPFPPKKIFDDNTAVANSQFLVADGCPLPFPPKKIFDDSVAA